MIERILLIDDDVEEHEIFCESLQEVSENLNCLYASNYQDAIEIISSKNVDTVFLDLNMPKESGFQVLNKLKTNHLSKDLRVLIYSNGVNKELCQQALEHGASGCIKKSDSIPLLASNIQKVLQLALADRFIVIL